LPHTGASATDGILGRCSMRALLPDRSVTGLADNPASPAPSLPHRILNHAVAQTTAPRLSASDHRRTSCPAAAAPLRWPAKRPLSSLRLAGGYRVGCSTTPEAAPLAFSLLLSPSRQRRLFGLCAPTGSQISRRIADRFVTHFS